MTPPRAVAQIVHISDLHLGVDARTDGAWGAVAWILSRIGRVFAKECDHLLRGIAPHDEDAFAHLRLALLGIQRRLPGWFDGGRTVLVVTGDLTTWGDDASRKQALQKIHELRDFLKEISGSEIPLGVVYGNHDVFPGSVGLLPFARTDEELAKRHSALRDEVEAFNGQWPTDSPVAQYPLQSGGTLSLYPVNTVLHDPNSNTLARGSLDNDRYWEIEFQNQLEALSCSGDPRDFRVILTHHPIVDPHHTVVKKLSNAQEAAMQLAVEGGTCGAGRPKRRVAQVILSGHTHAIFPPVGDLLSGSQPPLATDQLQLVCGTTAQRSFGTRLPQQTFQVIRFVEEGGREKRPSLLIERVVYYRQVGRFKAVAPADPSRPAEHVRIPL